MHYSFKLDLNRFLGSFCLLEVEPVRGLNSNLAEVFFFVILEVGLAKVILTVVAMPARQSIANDTLPNRLVVVKVFS